jgi:hemolysin D
MLGCGGCRLAKKNETSMSMTVNPAQQTSPEKRPAKKRTTPAQAMSRRDREFLPAALEILETPPAPAAVMLLLTLCMFTAAALTWSFVGRLEVHAVGQGKIESVGRTKLIQPLEPGKVRQVLVENGQKVNAGDLLIAFDPAELQADERDYAESLSAAKAELIRRRVAVDFAQSAKSAMSTSTLETPQIAWDESIPESARRREEAVLRADIAQLSDTLSDLDTQIAVKNATTERLNLSIGFQEKLISTLNDRVDMRNTGISLAVDTRVNLFDAMETLEKSQSSLASDQGELIETRAAVKELESQKQKAVSQFIADNEGKRADAERKALDIAEQLAKASAKLGRTQLFAPVGGTVQQLAVTTVGQVVTTGQQLMVVVPSGGPLLAEVYMNNADVGFIKVGQEVAIKVDAFPFTHYGVSHGKVIRIASDAIDEQDARRAESSATNLANSANMPASTAPPNFVFPVTVSLQQGDIRADGVNVPLTPGMTVTAEVKTDDRRVIDYLFSPIAKVWSEAMRER